MDQELSNISRIQGLCYTHPTSGEIYGSMRLTDNLRSIPGNGKLQAFAEDGCGNAFAVSSDQQVWFWDHETDDLLLLANNWETFLAGCHTPKPVELPPHKIKSVWIDPAFAKQFGIDVPPNSKKNKP